MGHARAQFLLEFREGARSKVAFRNDETIGVGFSSESNCLTDYLEQQRVRWLGMPVTLGVAGKPDEIGCSTDRRLGWRRRGILTRPLKCVRGWGGGLFPLSNHARAIPGASGTSVRRALYRGHA